MSNDDLQAAFEAGKVGCLSVSFTPDKIDDSFWDAVVGKTPAPSEQSDAPTTPPVERPLSATVRKRQERVQQEMLDTDRGVTEDDLIF